MSSATPEFLFVRPGDYVAIKKENCEDTKQKNENYWVGQVIDCIGGARNPNSWTLFQVANIDNGEITIINADIVEKILNCLKRCKGAPFNCIQPPRQILKKDLFGHPIISQFTAKLPKKRKWT